MSGSRTVDLDGGKRGELITNHQNGVPAKKSDTCVMRIESYCGTAIFRLNNLYSKATWNVH